MRRAFAVVSVLFAAGNGFAADPVYLDQLMETPVATLQSTFTGLKKEGCYRIAEERFVLVTIDKKDQKPWRILLTSILPCKRADTGPAIDLHARNGVEIGDTQLAVIQRLGRPDTANPPEYAQRKLGDLEFFYICRVSPDCARHTSVYLKDGKVSGIGEWYSE